jgi:demethylmenaquinone methyltransferase/2-methoxy-6-polyprenyl-1,4-benzoquinol methylase
MALPFADGEFDVVTISFGLRNVNDPKKALAEMLRVTAPGGMLLVCEFSHPQNPRSRPLPVLQRPDPADVAQRELERRRVRLPQRVDPDWPDQVTLSSWIRDAGWTRVAHRDLTFGIVALHRAVKPLV